MPEVSIDLPTHLIHVPAGHKNESRYYYIPIYNIPFGGAKEIIGRRLRQCHVIDWQFHNDGQSGWVCFACENDFEKALEKLHEMKQVNPKLEYSGINKRESFKLEVIDCTLTQPRFARLCSSRAKGALRRKADLMDWIRLDLPEVDGLRLDKIEDILDEAMFGSETVRVLVERLDSDSSAAECRQDAPPLVVLGSSKLPLRWPRIVSKWNPNVGTIQENAD
ncbi:hypothetical protein FSARC_14107 [Fusarium sarcochroum]|uniref:Uncharacterized protein n=1 Tax=Fusarium sarcochroum TaxID=1208366 RepID=A0A8H4SWM4_9HYPO|nr:hypothetical protein FSARC_14107 [Fusarium sarcochroum]